MTEKVFEIQRDAFINIMIMIAFIFLGGNLFRNKVIDTSSKFIDKLLFGTIAGIFGSYLTTQKYVGFNKKTGQSKIKL